MVHPEESQPVSPFPPAAPIPVQVELRGKVVCIPELMHQLYQTELPSDHSHFYGFEAVDGSVYTLLRTKFSEALFVDERLRAKDLLLKGEVFPKSHVFEPARMRSVRNGTVYDLYYYCNVCSIETVSPGPCACCQGPVELMERPVRASAADSVSRLRNSEPR
jgi:hypothetical protein